MEKEYKAIKAYIDFISHCIFDLGLMGKENGAWKMLEGEYAKYRKIFELKPNDDEIFDELETLLELAKKEEVSHLINGLLGFRPLYTDASICQLFEHFELNPAIIKDVFIFIDGECFDKEQGELLIMLLKTVARFVRRVRRTIKQACVIHNLDGKELRDNYETYLAKSNDAPEKKELFRATYLFPDVEAEPDSRATDEVSEVEQMKQKEKFFMLYALNGNNPFFNPNVPYVSASLNDTYVSNFLASLFGGKASSWRQMLMKMKRNMSKEEFSEKVQEATESLEKLKANKGKPQ